VSLVPAPPRSTAAQLPWNTRGGEQLCGGALGRVRQHLQQLQLVVGVQRPGERPQRLHLDAGHGAHRGDQAVGHPVRRQVDHDVVHGETAAALEDVDRDDVHAGGAQGGGDGAEDAGPVGDDQAQEMGHGSSRGALLGGRICVDRRQQFPAPPPRPSSAPRTVRPPT
jgi:hypothetical protein